MTQTLADALVRSARTWPDRPALAIAGEHPLTYRELLDEAEGFAATLRRSHPDARHVAILMPNCTRWAVAFWGTMLAGRTGVLLNPRLTDPELVYQVQQSHSDLVVAAPPQGRDLGSLFVELDRADASVPVIWAGAADDAPRGSAWPSAREHARDDQAAAADPSGTAVIIYTSGTTSRPKGVELSHQALLTNARLVGVRFAVSDEDRIFCAGPFFHSGGLTMHLVLSMVHGATAYSTPYFDPATVVDLVEREQITIYNGIETLFLRLTSAPGFHPDRLRSIRTGWATGTPAILDTIAQDVGVPGVVGCYGISEAGPNVLMSSWDDSPEHRLHTVGRPQEGVTCRVVDMVTGEPAPVGVPGELLVRSPSLMSGYFGKPDETAEALRDNWLHTGDLVVVRDDGYFEFAGRSKDIVRTGGENVSCAEVENAIYEVAEAAVVAVVGIEDAEYGEVVVAAISPHPDHPAQSEDDIIARLRGMLAGYKVPKEIVFVDAMPLTESGKVQKGRLREHLATRLRRVGPAVAGRPRAGSDP